MVMMRPANFPFRVNRHIWLLPLRNIFAISQKGFFSDFGNCIEKGSVLVDLGELTDVEKLRKADRKVEITDELVLKHDVVDLVELKRTADVIHYVKNKDFYVEFIF